MCGGDLNIEPGSTICQCEYCGSKQTIPNTEDEKRLKLHERANKLRYECEFDKASGVYESIVAEYQNDAEAYWGLVLCKYGIEYVDDPKTGKKIPTCHRSSFDSIFDDSDFDRVMENADSVAIDIYRGEAKQIEELRKGIISVSSKEEPYDIFICYKETADNGDRTIDSVLAQNVYKELENNDYRVFFSRISLEDKLGKEYEPYIFAALNSAKVMLAFGTSYKNYNAVWVKNEWSRFLQLMENDINKVLIPCYKDIDAYDMPKEFYALQAQDMGKVGAMQDLIRGIDKIFGRDKKIREAKSNSSNIVGEGNALVKRGYFALEDGEWEKALEYFDQALNQDAENAEIHLGIFLAKRKHQDINAFLENQIENLGHVSGKEFQACEPDDEKIRKIVEENYVNGYLSKSDIIQQFNYSLKYRSIKDALENEKSVYEDKDWKKAERFAKGELASQIKNVKDKHIYEIDSRIKAERESDKAIIEKITNNYHKFIEDTEKKVIEQRFQAESQREKDYVSLCDGIINAESEEQLRAIITGFKQIIDYKDSSDRIEKSKRKISEIRKEEEKKQQEIKVQAKRKMKKLIVILASFSMLIVVGIVSYKMIEAKVIIPKRQYDEAVTLMSNQKYDEAIVAFETLGDYRDSKNKIDEIKRLKAEAENKKNEEKYNVIVEKLKNNLYEEAVDIVFAMEEGEYKTKAKKDLVNYLMDDFSGISSNNKDELKRVNEKLILIYENLDEEERILLKETNDKKCIECALDGSILSEPMSKYTPVFIDYSTEYLEMIIDKDYYQEDIDKFEAIKSLYEQSSTMWKKKDKMATNLGDGLTYDKSNGCLRLSYKSDKAEVDLTNYYIVSYDDRSLYVGEKNNIATHQLYVGGSIKVLDNQVEMEPLIIFKNK